MAGESPPVRVLIAEQRSLVRAGLAQLLAGHPALVVHAEATSAAELLTAVSSGSIDVVVLPVGLSGAALDTVRTMRRHYPAVEAVLYEVPEEDSFFLAALQAGVKGLADQRVDLDYLVTAVRGVAAGEVMVSPQLARFIAASYARLLARSQPALRASDELTDRELDVLRLIATGASNRVAGLALAMSEHTVRAHLRNISRKLGARSRVQAVSEAIRMGIIAANAPPAGGGAGGGAGRG